jgi:hypothetical protein
MILDSLASSDRVQLLELYGRGVTVLDLGRPKDWAHVFLPDAVLECGGSKAQQFKGREELLALGRRMMFGEFEIALGSAPPSRRHFLNNISLFHVGQSQAFGCATLAVIGIGGEAPRWLATGTYSDRLYKTSNGCWCFRSRTFVPDGAAPGSSEVPATGHPITASGRAAA